MALSDRDIVITPNKGQVDDPKIVFSGANANVSAQTITLAVYPSNGGTLSFEGSVGQLFYVSNNSTGTLFGVNNSSGLPSLKVNANGTVTITESGGNVGIGTGTPITDLHVQGQTVITGRVGIGTANVLTLNSNILSVYGTAMVYGNIDLANPTGGTAGIYFNDGTYQTTAFTGSTTTPSFGLVGTVQVAGAGNTFTGNSANFFWDNTNARLGIGTVVPTQKLDVVGTVRGTTFEDRTNANFFVTPNSTSYLRDVYITTSNGGSTGYTQLNEASLYMLNDASLRDIFLRVGGNSYFNTNFNLGIGTTSPTNILTVRSTATPAWFNTVNSAVSSNNFEILVGNSVVHGTTVGYVNNATVPYGYLSAGTTTRNIIIAANGRVGLGGTTVPQNMLDVNGNVAIGSAYAGARTAPANGLIVQGSVGLGTFTPTAPLDVRGNVYIDGTHNLFTNRVGIGTSSALGTSANVLSVYGTAMIYGNIDLSNVAAGGTGIYFSDGTFQNTAYVPTTYTTFTYTGNGSTTTYSTSPVTSSNINNTMVYVNGVYQRKETYGWSGTTITFDVAPPNFATIEIVVVQGVNAPYGSVAGDISVNGNITVSGGAIIASGSNTYVFNTVATGVYIGGNARDVQIGNAVSTTRFNSANASINTTTGAVVTTGGVGIGGNLNVGGTRSLFTNSVGIGTSAALGTNANVFSVYGTAMVYGNIELSNPTGGVSGIYFNDGSYLTSANSSGTYVTKTSNYTAVNGDKLLCDTSGGTFTVTLPATPLAGTTVTIYDKANFTAIPLTVARNGSTIENLADDFSLDIGQTKNEIIYDGTTWHIYVSIGPRGLPGADASTAASVAYSIALG